MVLVGTGLMYIYVNVTAIHRPDSIVRVPIISQWKRRDIQDRIHRGEKEKETRTEKGVERKRYLKTDSDERGKNRERDREGEVSEDIHRRTRGKQRKG